jgi:predicted ester cyclase
MPVPCIRPSKEAVRGTRSRHVSGRIAVLTLIYRTDWRYLGECERKQKLDVAFPNLHVNIEDMVAEDDRVAVRATWTGTHKDVFPLMPAPVSNRQVTFTGMVFWRISNGKVAERWAVIDRLAGCGKNDSAT